MNLNEFIDIFFTQDYFLILLIILLLILLIITIQLIKSQYIPKEEIEEEKEETLDNLFIDFMNKDKTEETIEIPKINEISLPLFDEEDEENNAIISNDELEHISQTRNINSNSSLINQYELEQEQKAIISYEELLKNAANLKMNYEEPLINDGPIIRKVDIETPTLERNLNYIEEVNFLSTLKEFRANLK